MSIPEVLVRKARKPQKPPRRLVYGLGPFGFLKRWRLSWRLSSYFYGNMHLGEFWWLLFGVRILAFVISVAIGVTCAFALPADAKLYGIGGAVALFFIFNWIHQLYLSGRRRGVTTQAYWFNARHASELSQMAKGVLRQELPNPILDALGRLREHQDEPFMVVRKVVPIALRFPIRPRWLRRPIKSASRQHRIESAKRRMDSVAAGMLSILRVEPSARFNDDRADEKIVVNYYTRNDVQELPDIMQPDMFLRFHQSTVERSIPDINNNGGRICRFKTYTAVSNGLNRPIQLITVKDIIECLTNANGEYSAAEHAAIFERSPDLNADNVLGTLMESHYRRQPPRAIRYLKGEQGQLGPILRHFADHGYIMAFDAARVWVDSNGTDRHAQAIMALRSAIGLVSRAKVYEIKLRKRDMLIVDNLRVMTARQEDGNFVGLRECWVTFFHGLTSLFLRDGLDYSGWWLRSVYGYPEESRSEDDS